MSFRVLVIPKDPTHNRYILRPLVERMLTETGKPNARVTILTNPRLGGYDHAVAAIRNELPLRYGHLDLWLFMPDADKAGQLAAVEKQAEGNGVRLICCAAKPEIEAWLLAGHREQLAITWPDVVWILAKVCRSSRPRSKYLACSRPAALRKLCPMTPLHPRGLTQQRRGFLKSLAGLSALGLIPRHTGCLYGAQVEAPSKPLRLIVDADTANEIDDA